MWINKIHRYQWDFWTQYGILVHNTRFYVEKSGFLPKNVPFCAFFDWKMMSSQNNPFWLVESDVMCKILLSDWLKSKKFCKSQAKSVVFFARPEGRVGGQEKKSIARAAQNFFQLNYFIGHRAILRAILRVLNPFSNCTKIVYLPFRYRIFTISEFRIPRQPWPKYIAKTHFMNYSFWGNRLTKVCFVHFILTNLI